MNILVTGAKGFVGRNLCETLYNIRDGKDNFHKIAGCDTPANLRIMEYDIDSTKEDLREYCEVADFVFNLAGVNRPKDNKEFMDGNFGFASELLDELKRAGNKCPVMLSSSIQASLEGRYAGSDYGKSKLAGEELFFEYGEKEAVNVLVYRFPNLFGKWCRPNYNSAVATFCNNIAKGLPITVTDPAVELDLVYIDNLVDEMIRALNGEQTMQGKYCYVPEVHHVTLGEIVDLLKEFDNQTVTGMMAYIPGGSFAKALYSTYLSYLPYEKVAYNLNMKCDDRGSFTEFIKTKGFGQVSVNVSKPGVTKGLHWHHSKWEIFLVVSGHGMIRERKIGLDENGKEYPVLEFEVDGSKLTPVQMLPGYTHSIVNLSETDDLVTLMWANEEFDSNRPDTYREDV